jgi:hypothetical protein
MFYKVVQAESTARLTRLVEDLLHQGWILVGGITFDGQNYLQALTRS